MESSYPSGSINIPYIVDLQTQASRLACQLGCLTHFLHAATELLSCSFLLPHNFCLHSRKIVTLIEIARKCLAASHIQPYAFSSCPQSFLPYKEAYTKLLNMLHEKQHYTDHSVEERIKRLLVPLSTDLHISRNGDTLLSPPPAVSKSKRKKTSYYCQSPQPFPNVPPPSLSMPPPDAFPSSPEKGKQLPAIIRRKYTRLWDPEEIREASRKKRRRPASPIKEAEQENVAPLAYQLRPLPRKFGIFCTGKNSMYKSKETVGRATTVRSLIKE